jgi:hypothetical protein
VSIASIKEAISMVAKIADTLTKNKGKQKRALWWESEDIESIPMKLLR